MLEAPRGLSHPQTSFIGTVCQGIHHTPFRAAHAPENPNDSFKRQTTNHHTVKMITKRSISKPDSKKSWRNRDKANDDKSSCIARVHYPVLKPPRAPTGPGPAAPRPTASPRPGASGNRTHPKNGWGGGQGTQKHTHHSPHGPKDPQTNDLFHTSTPRQTDPETIPGAWATTDAGPAS